MHKIKMTSDLLHRLRLQAKQLPPLLERKTGAPNSDSAVIINSSGLNFMEHRPYETGDSPRIIDWSLTAKKGTPWVRQFHEDATNTSIFFLDLYTGIFFGSKRFCKSVILLQTMALIGWQAVDKGFKTGCVIRTEKGLHYIKPDSGSEHFSCLIKQVIKLYHVSRTMLSALSGKKEPGKKEPGKKEPANKRPGDRKQEGKNHLEAGLLQLHNYISQNDHIIILSDFITLDTDNHLPLESLRKKASISAIRISDPLETGSLPEGDFPVSNGRQVYCLANKAIKNQSFKTFCKKHNQVIKNYFSLSGIKLIELNSMQESYCQLKQLASDRRELHHG